MPRCGFHLLEIRELYCGKGAIQDSLVALALLDCNLLNQFIPAVLGL